MDEIELKPCPFCGGTNIKLLVFQNGSDYIECKNCRITIEYRIDVKIDHDVIDTKKKVITNKWNTRKGD